MEWTSADVIGVISYLLPGFVAAWIFYALTPHPRREPFERVVQALIFTAIVHAALYAFRFLFSKAVGYRVIGNWPPDQLLFWSLVAATAIGLVFDLFANRDWLHRFLRWIGLTKRTSYPSEWFSALNGSKRYVVLHLKGERRLQGWPCEWPDDPRDGHFIMMEPVWLIAGGSSRELDCVESIMVPAADVEMVEMLKDSCELLDHVPTVRKELQGDGKQTAPARAQQVESSERKKELHRSPAKDGNTPTDSAAPSTEEVAMSMEPRNRY